MKKDYQGARSSFSVPLNGIEGIPQNFIDLYELDEWSSVKTSPYYNSVHILVPLLAIPCERASVIRFLAFVAHMEEGFKTLLRERDPRALLLLAHWYAKVWKAIWWIERRAVLECQAICMYLDKEHIENKLLREMLMFPRRRCGLAVETIWFGEEELMLLKNGTTEPIPELSTMFMLDGTGKRAKRLAFGIIPNEGR